MRGLLYPTLLLMALATPLVQAAAGFDLWQVVEAQRNDDASVVTSPDRAASARQLFASLVASAARGGLMPGAAEQVAALGMAMEVHGDTLLIASRPENADGMYAIRLGGGQAPLVLQAPHAWYDLNTGNLVARLFQEGLGRAACFNSAHRYRGAGALLRVGTEDADLAHRTSTLFQAATLGLADGLTDPLFVQLHGFGAGYEGHAAVVASGRSLQPQQWVEWTVSRLQVPLSPYGHVVSCASVADLCATTNVQSQALAGAARFLHVELSYAVRKNLLSEDEGRHALAEALRDLAERTP